MFEIKIKYNWNWETRTLEDSSSVILSMKELVDITKLKKSIDNNLGNVIDRVKKLDPFMSYNKKYKLVDSIQQVMEKRYFLIDSIVYVDWIK